LPLQSSKKFAIRNVRRAEVQGRLQPTQKRKWARSNPGLIQYLSSDLSKDRSGTGRRFMFFSTKVQGLPLPKEV
jgi:hypothetical protein